MRHYKYLFIAAALLLGACSKSGMDPVPQTGDPIALQGDIATRAPLAAARPFYLIAVKENATAFSNPFIPQIEATLGTDNSITTTGKYYWPVDGNPLRFYGFMRASDAASATFAPVDGGLTLTPGVGPDHDYLLSNNLAATGNAAGNRMSFRHLMTQVKITVTAEAGVELPLTLRGSFAGGNTNAVYSAFEQSPDRIGDPDGLDYTPTFLLTLNSGALAPTEIIYHLIPDNATTITRIIDVAINDHDADDIAIVAPAGESDILLKGGVSYEVEIKINARGVASATVSLAPWTEHNLGNTSAEVDQNSGYNLVWDENSAPVTAIEMTGTGNTTNLFNVETDAQVANNGATKGTLKTASAFSNVAVYHHNTRVDLGTEGTHWEYDNATKTITVKAVLVAAREHLEAIDATDENLAKHYFQVTDVDLNNQAWDAIGLFVYNDPAASRPFSGTYDGLNFDISRIFIDDTAADQNALFEYCTGTISNVRLVSGSIKGQYNVGGIVGKLEDGTIDNCYNAATLYGEDNNVGGIVGNVIGGTVTNSRNAGTLTGIGGNIGGIAGINDGAATITGCVHEGLIEALTAGKTCFGGILGYANHTDTRIENCTNKGTVKSAVAVRYLAGIVGYSKGTLPITDCTNAGTVEGKTSTEVAGVAGFIKESNVTRCFNTSNVTGKNTVGGIVAKADGAGITISACENKGIVESTGYYIGGIVGSSKATVSDCHNKNEVKSGTGSTGMIGGVVGVNYAAVTDCTNSGKVTCLGSMAGTGGICGTSENASTITNCNNSGEITTINDLGSWIGGITGSFLNPAVNAMDNCENTGKVTSTSITVGGIVGLSRGFLNNVRNKADITGLSSVGGLVAQNYGTVQHSHNTGKVSGSGYYHLSSQNYGNQTVGGIVAGNLEDGVLYMCINDGAVSGQIHVGGISGNMSAGKFDGSTGNPRIERCTNNGTVTGMDYSTIAYGQIIAGIVGLNGSVTAYDGNYRAGLVLGCGNNGAVTGNDYVAGIVGYNSGEVVACANKAPITCPNYGAGGVIGWNTKSTTVKVTACYNTALVSGYYSVGGIIAMDESGKTHQACFNTGDVTGKTTGDRDGVIYGAMYGSALSDTYYGGNSPISYATPAPTQFNDAGQWPGASWTSLGGHGVSAYWKSLGSWPSGGNPTYPKLYWE